MDSGNLVHPNYRSWIIYILVRAHEALKLNQEHPNWDPNIPPRIAIDLTMNQLQQEEQSIHTELQVFSLSLTAAEIIQEERE